MMYSGDDFYDDEVTSGIDVLAAADFLRDSLRNTSSCPGCGYRDPVRIEDGGCERCRDFPRCSICGRWIMDVRDGRTGEVLRGWSHGEADHG